MCFLYAIFFFGMTVALRSSEMSMKTLNLELGRWRNWWITSVLSLRYATQIFFYFFFVLLGSMVLYLLNWEFLPFSQRKIDWISSEWFSGLTSLSSEDLSKISWLLENLLFIKKRENIICNSYIYLFWVIQIGCFCKI